ncbi:hypothetical protein IW261DRAFT_1370982 [Armillaria novae-zelandiae]|uniref:Uncharacterized protein n=1 Tax=Armillaria novae-zelandiae TaxID=153914 RepID=A0AA39NVE1_9AGAR|nr:hypothetical protein IW261DRAFT_1370982 [Armillaria novae-zelandiae]
MSIQQRFSGLASARSWIPDDAYYDRPDTGRSQTSSSLPPGSRSSFSVAATSGSSVIPDIPDRGPRAIVFRAAKEVTRILREGGYTFAILGSTACYLYGNDRLPNDLNIVMSSYACDLQSLKRFLVAINPIHFQLVGAKTPGAPWKVLWYQGYIDGRLEKTKVDILKPGILNLPMIFSEAIVDKQGFPVVPMSILLLHKLQGWKDNMDSDIQRHRNKCDADEGDIFPLLEIIVESMSVQERANATHWKRFALERFDAEFRGGTESRMWLFCSKYPQCRDMWKKLGW